VVLPGFGHTIDFWNHQVEAGDRLVNLYLDTGRVDASRFVPQKIDFTPPVRQTTLGKLLAGTMLGLALFTVLSLAWMARRVRTRGRLGRRTRIVVRSAWALVLGLGGWFAAALVALIAAPSVPIDAGLLMVLSMATPVAAASYCAWRDPDRAATPAAGLAAAVAGALIGAWLGLHCATAMLAVATTLVGAVAGANLALIACDIASETKRRRHATEPRVSDLREPLLHGAQA
jgi:MFS family permease